MDVTEQQKAAFHEAGHAVAAFLNGVTNLSVSIVSESGTGGHGFCDMAGQSARTMCSILFGGGVAEQKLVGKETTLAEMGAVAFTDYCMASQVMSEVHEDLDDDEMHDLPEMHWDDARWSLSRPQHWRCVEALAAALLERKEIPGPESEQIMFAAFKADESDDT